jgi:hypothetical protein
MAVSAGISAGGSLLGGLFGSKSASKAASQQVTAEKQVAQLAETAAGNAQTGVTTAASGVQDTANTGATQLANATTAGQTGISTGITGANTQLGTSLSNQLALLQPYISQGGTSLSQLQQLSGTNGPLSQQFAAPTTAQLNDPNNPNSQGYQFTLQQGQQAIDRSAAAQGNLFSTGTAKSLAGYTEGTASQYAQQAYNNALTTFNTNRQGTLSQIAALQNLTGLGYSAAGTGSGATGAAGSQQAQNTLAGATQIAGLGLQGTQAATNTALTGAQAVQTGAAQAGQFGLQGAQIAGTALAGAGNAQAAGTVGSTNAWLNALSGGTNALSQYAAYNNTGLIPGYGYYPGLANAGPIGASTGQYPTGSGTLWYQGSPYGSQPAVPGQS